jgi:hypothetical protein
LLACGFKNKYKWRLGDVGLTPLYYKFFGMICIPSWVYLQHRSATLTSMCRYSSIVPTSDATLGGAGTSARAVSALVSILVVMKLSDVCYSTPCSHSFGEKAIVDFVTKEKLIPKCPMSPWKTLRIFGKLL